MRVVLDTNVLVAVFRSPAGASAEILRLALRKKIVALASVPLFVEYEAVLSRAEHLDAARLTPDDVVAALDGLAGLIEPVETFFLWRPRLRDADDDMVLEVAVNGRADAIVTFNVRDFAVSFSGFGIPAIVPGELLRRL